MPASEKLIAVLRFVIRAGTGLLLGACAQLPAFAPVDNCRDCPALVAIPAGRFVMGSPDDDPENWGPEREGPQHEVTITHSFAIGKYEVTRAQFARFIAETGDIGGGCFDWNGRAWNQDAARNWRNPGFAQTDHDPVVCVNWDDATAYARWLSRKTGQPWRLPSEAEWEYAARAGTTTLRPWGNSADDGCRYANFADQTLWQALRVEPAARCADGHVYTAPVGSLLPNDFGLHDMLGNAWEWTADCWHDGYQGAPSDGTARDDPGCVRRVNRGAGWNSNPRNVRSGNRGNYAGIYRYNIIGFRMAKSKAD